MSQNRIFIMEKTIKFLFVKNEKRNKNDGSNYFSEKILFAKRNSL